jgi:hypothetical protein
MIKMNLKVRMFLLGMLNFTFLMLANGQNERVNTISCKVVDIENGGPLIGVNVLIKETTQYHSTNLEGSFKVTNVPENGFTLVFSYIGYEGKEILVKPQSKTITIRLKSQFTELEEVVITSERPDANVMNSGMGRNVLEISAMKDLPPLAGEIDVLKSMTLLPGVSSVGEASSGLNVRGGSFDQNLILLGGGVLYNPSHLFGFFSSINAEVVDNIVLYKGVIPAKFGGRASSVVDIGYKVGDYDKWKGNVGVGMVSSKLAITGPVIKEKLALTLTGRMSYVNWLLSLVDDVGIKNSSANFYDVNGKLDYRLNDKNYLSYSIYQSSDDFNLASDTVNQWSNFSQVATWKHTFTEKLTSNVTLAESKYVFSILNDSGVNNFDLTSNVIDRSGRLEFNYALNEKNNFNAGIEARLLKIDPGNFELETNELGDSEALQVQEENGREYAAYVYNTHELNDKIGISYGLRYNLYQYVGEQLVNDYVDLFPRNGQNIINTTSFGANEVIETYARLAPRFGIRYSLTPSTSIKIGVNKMNQFIQLISNTATLSPVNVWKLSDTFVVPQEVVQYSFGVFKNLKNNTYETSIETYYKDIDNVVDYKDGAVLLLNENIETELLNGIGKAYGVELFLKKKTGKLTGWASYTYSRSLRKVDGAFPETRINSGEWYPSNFDKPHDLTLVTSYKPRKNLTFSAVFTYSTGRPVTYPTDKLKLFGQDIAYFDSRNESRIPDYHRLDLSVTFQINTTIKLLKGDWTFGIYNSYGNNNAYSVFFDDVEGAPPQAYKLSILNTPVPSLSYNVNF